jgi:oligoribonuclease
MFFWFDCETTGLDEKSDLILEVAVILTDDKLREISRYEAVIHRSDEELSIMNEWAKNQHASSGLLEACRKSSVSLEMAEDALIMILKTEGVARPYIAGSSVHFDVGFIKQYMPNLAAILHYRILDVSSFSIAYRDVLGIELPPSQGSKHRAMSDIESSLADFKLAIARVK